jgi:hypothetical protein
MEGFTANNKRLPERVLPITHERYEGGYNSRPPSYIQTRSTEEILLVYIYVNIYSYLSTHINICIFIFILIYCINIDINRLHGYYGKVHDDLLGKIYLHMYSHMYL